MAGEGARAVAKETYLPLDRLDLPNVQHTANLQLNRTRATVHPKSAV